MTELSLVRHFFLENTNNSSLSYWWLVLLNLVSFLSFADHCPPFCALPLTRVIKYQWSSSVGHETSTYQLASIELFFFGDLYFTIHLKHSTIFFHLPYHFTQCYYFLDGSLWSIWSLQVLFKSPRETFPLLETDISVLIKRIRSTSISAEPSTKFRQLL